MFGLCGWFGGSAVTGTPADALELMAKRLPHAVTPRSLVELSTGGAVTASGGPAGTCAKDGDRLAVITGMPRWSDPTIAAIARDRGPAYALLVAFHDHGRDVLSKVSGSFALAVLDSRAGKALLAIDRMGIGRLCYGHTASGMLVFGTTTDSVRCHPEIAASVSPQGLFNYLFHYVSPAPRTLFGEIDKLPAGHYLECANGRSVMRRYWQLDYAAVDTCDAERLRGELVDTLRRAVRRAADGIDLSKAGAFLSGGLDSSTVTGMLAELTPGPARTFTIGFDLKDFDESAYAAITAQHYGTNHKLYCVTPSDVFDLVSNVAKSFDEPFGNSSAVPTYFCARLARDNGVETMFAGDGGDEIFCGNERYLEHRKYEWFVQMPVALRQLALASVRLAPGSIRTVRRGRNYLNFLNTPLPDRLYYMVAQHGADLTEYFDADFSASVDRDEPVRIARDLYNATDADLDVVQRMMLMDQQLTLADNDLRKVEGACEMAGIHVRYPFLDDELVAFSGKVPADLHTQSGILRDFFKQAFRDFLPSEVITKRKHGFGLPTEHWLRDHLPLRTLCEESIASFGDRRVIRRDIADTFIGGLRDGSRPDLLSMSWDIMILELWLQARGLSI